MTLIVRQARPLSRSRCRKQPLVLSRLQIHGPGEELRQDEMPGNGSNGLCQQQAVEHICWDQTSAAGTKGAPRPCALTLYPPITGREPAEFLLDEELEIVVRRKKWR
jgi:hypothetical protein